MFKYTHLALVPGLSAAGLPVDLRVVRPGRQGERGHTSPRPADLSVPLLSLGSPAAHSPSLCRPCPGTVWSRRAAGSSWGMGGRWPDMQTPSLESALRNDVSYSEVLNIKRHRVFMFIKKGLSLTRVTKVKLARCSGLGAGPPRALGALMRTTAPIPGTPDPGCTPASVNPPPPHPRGQSFFSAGPQPSERSQAQREGRQPPREGQGLRPAAHCRRPRTEQSGTGRRVLRGPECGAPGPDSGPPPSPSAAILPAVVGTVRGTRAARPLPCCHPEGTTAPSRTNDLPTANPSSEAPPCHDGVSPATVGAGFGTSQTTRGGLFVGTPGTWTRYSRRPWQGRSSRARAGATLASGSGTSRLVPRA